MGTAWLCPAVAPRVGWAQICGCPGWICTRVCSGLLGYAFLGAGPGSDPTTELARGWESSCLGPREVVLAEEAHRAADLWLTMRLVNLMDLSGLSVNKQHLTPAVSEL